MLEQTKKTDLNDELRSAIMQGNTEQVKVLMTDGANVNHRFSNGWRPLHLAAEVGDIAMLRLLIDSGAVTDSPVDPTTGSQTPLHVAVAANNLEAARLLLENGGDPFAGASFFGGAPIDCAWTEDAEPMKDLLRRAMTIRKIDIGHYESYILDERPFDLQG